MTYFKILTLGGFMLFTVGCSNAQLETGKAQDNIPGKSAHMHSETGYKKMTAPVQFTHNFKGEADVGVMEDIRLNVKSLVPGAKVSLEVVSGPNVKVFKSHGFDGSKRGLDAKAGEDMSLQFQPLAEGLHQITVRANVYLPDGQFMTSTYSVPVAVGEEFKRMKQSSAKNTNTAPKPKQVGGLAIMEAQETIKD